MHRRKAEATKCRGPKQCQYCSLTHYHRRDFERCQQRTEKEKLMSEMGGLEIPIKRDLNDPRKWLCANPSCKYEGGHRTKGSATRCAPLPCRGLFESEFVLVFSWFISSYYTYQQLLLTSINSINLQVATVRIQHVDKSISVRGGQSRQNGNWKIDPSCH